MKTFKYALLCAATVALASRVDARPANTIACGASITTDTIELESDLGPCPADGLFINSAQTAVSVNLNGHSITGSGNGAGLRIGTSNGGVTVKGPGHITGFGSGILVEDDDVLVYGVTLNTNKTGIGIGNANRVRIVSNTVRGGNKGQIGVGTGNAGDIFIYQNAITGHSKAGVAIFGESKTTVDSNTIIGSRTGIFAGPPDLVCFTIRGNNIFHNRANGIDVSPKGIVGRNLTQALATVGSCFLVEDNTVTGNGGSGIVMEQASTLDQVLIQDNIVRNNEANGISLIGGQGSQVIGNVALQNHGVDLLWDASNSPSSCWKQNIFTTNSPSELPQCP